LNSSQMELVQSWGLGHSGPHFRSSQLGTWDKTRDVSHCCLAIYIKKYLYAKEELWKLKYFTMQKYNLQKILWKKPKSFKII
jgi:hypothetical protein